MSLQALCRAPGDTRAALLRGWPAVALSGGTGRPGDGPREVRYIRARGGRGLGQGRTQRHRWDLLREGGRKSASCGVLSAAAATAAVAAAARGWRHYNSVCSARWGQVGYYPMRQCIVPREDCRAGCCVRAWCLLFGGPRRAWRHCARSVLLAAGVIVSLFYDGVAREGDVDAVAVRGG